MKLLYALLAISLIVAQCHADLGSKLTSAQDQIETIKNNIESNVFSVRSKCCGGGGTTK